MDLNHNSKLTWNNLPTVILREVFTYLSPEDKISASSTCKNWRSALFDPLVWEQKVFTFSASDCNDVYSIYEKKEFLKSAFAGNIKHLLLKFDAWSKECLDAVLNILHSLTINQRLSGISLVPNRCTLTRCAETLLEQILVEIVKTHGGFQNFSIGCIPRLCRGADFLEYLSRNSSHTLRLLGLASLEPERDFFWLIPPIKLNMESMKTFSNLQILSINFEEVSEDLLRILNDVRQLQRMVIHISSPTSGRQRIDDIYWIQLMNNCPNLTVRLNFLRVYLELDALVYQTTNDHMRVTHIRVMFCKQLNVAAIDLLIHRFYRQLHSFWWVDSFNNAHSLMVVQHPRNYQEDVHINPFVLIAWRCMRLRELVIFGCKYMAEDIVGIGRLRGAHLKTLHLAQSDMIFTDHSENSDLPSLCNEVSESLGTSWAPFTDEQLPEIIVNGDAGSSDEYILSVVLKDLE